MNLEWNITLLIRTVIYLNLVDLRSNSLNLGIRIIITTLLHAFQNGELLLSKLNSVYIFPFTLLSHHLLDYWCMILSISCQKWLGDSAYAQIWTFWKWHCQFIKVMTLLVFLFGVLLVQEGLSSAHAPKIKNDEKSSIVKFFSRFLLCNS